MIAQTTTLLLCMMIPLFAALTLPLLSQMRRALSVKTNHRQHYEVTMVLIYSLAGIGTSLVISLVAAIGSLILMGGVNITSLCGLSCLDSIGIVGACLFVYWDSTT
jgi:hypothetical protein